MPDNPEITKELLYMWTRNIDGATHDVNAFQVTRDIVIDRLPDIPLTVLDALFPETETGNTSDPDHVHDDALNEPDISVTSTSAGGQ